MKKRFVVLAFSLYLTIGFAAETDGYSKEFNICMDRSKGVTINMLDCIDVEHRKQDKQLNQAYKKIMSRLNAENQERLKLAQRSWIKWRDDDTKLLGNITGGTMDRVIGSSDYLQKTVDRVKFLNDLNELQ